jgi:raffinose/stachyose/melibiose transport system permease protein
MRSNKLAKGFFAVFVNALMALLAVTCVFPIIWMIYSSLKTQAEFTLNILTLPAKPQFTNYIRALKEGRMGTYFLNSAYNSVISVVLALVIAYITGYCIARYKFKGRNFIYFYFLSGMLIPIYALLIPIFIEFKWLGLINRQFTLIIPYIAFQLPMSVFLVESFVKTIPTEIEEAAYMDGSSLILTMIKIIMPICGPVLATSLILSFLGNWNEFPLALVLLSKESLKTLPVGLTNFVGAYTVDYTLMFAALVVATLPVIIIYLVFYKQIIQGMVAGAVKG